MKSYVTAILALGLATPAIAEQAVPVSVAIPPPTPAALAPAASAQPVAVFTPVVQDSILRAGTEVPLLTREELTTQKKKLRVGQRFQLEVASNVEMNGVVVIPAGTPVIGEVTEVRNKGMWGKSGYINARIVSLRLGDRLVRVSGTFDDKGVTGTAGVVGAVVLIPVAGFFMTGTSARIPTNSPVKGFLDEDVAFRVAPSTMRAIEVPAPVQAAQAPVNGSVATPAPGPVLGAPPLTPATVTVDK